MDAGASDDGPDGHGEREAGDMDGYGDGSGAVGGSRSGAGRPGSAEVVSWLGWAVAVGILGWIDPMLVVLLAVVVGIVWLRRSDAHPVHWGPVPRGGRSPGSAAGHHGGGRSSAGPRRQLLARRRPRRS